MTFAGSLFLIAVGAILRFATHIHLEGIDLQTVGVILMIVGAVGFVIALWKWAVWSRRSRRPETGTDRPGPPPSEYHNPYR
ncbi:MAG: hypothetical protein JSU06_12950 [Actinobacteria bacterium]|nr:hypothetical protein [Actinomycetota bacterium]